jgi:[ribosomal protein S5]-alanine N-acetyltransferase
MQKKPTDFPQLSTSRLLLREVVDDDAPSLLAIHGDAQAMRWYGNDPIASLAHARQMVRTFSSLRELPNPGTRWGIQLHDSSRLIGTCGLFKWHRAWKSAVLGYELARSAWGAGLMGEALCATLHWGFGAMSLHRVEAQVHPDNERSIKLLHSLGFVQEGRAREAGFWLGRHHDMLLFGLLANDFNPCPLPA